MKTVCYIIGSALSGATLYLCHDNSLWLISVIIIIVFLLKIIDNNNISEKLVQVCINTFFLTYFTLTFWFLHRSVRDGSIIGLVLIVIPWIVYCLPMLLLSVCKQFKIEVFLILWLLVESIFKNIEVGNSMLQLGILFGNIPDVISWYQYTGPSGGSVWLLLSCYFLYKIIFKSKKNLIWLSVIVIVPLLTNLLINNNTVEKTRSVGVILNNRNFDSILLDAKRIRLDYILTAEAVSVLFKQSYQANKLLTSIKRTLVDSIEHTSVFLGSWMIEEGNLPSNVIVIFSKYRKPIFRYKQKFIPFGEYLPYESFLGKWEDLKKMIPNLITSKNNDTEVAIINNDVIGPLICYEALFTNFMSELCNAGAEIFFVSASNGFINDIHTEEVIKNIMICNAITTHKNVLRATDQGYSYIISSNGILLPISNDIEYLQVSLNQKKTFYTKHYKKVTFIYLLTLGGVLFTLLWLSNKKTIIAQFPH